VAATKNAIAVPTRARQPLAAPTGHQATRYPSLDKAQSEKLA
jgi:hypothetical protein